MDNLVKLLANMATPQLTNAAAELVGERSETIGAAMKVAGPLLVGALSSKGSSTSGAQQILDLLGQNPELDNVVSNPVSQLMGEGSSNSILKLGEMVLPMLLGNKSSGITDAIISMTGLKKSSVGSLLTLAAPMLLGLVKKSMSGQSMNASNLAGLLAGQKDFVKAAAPAGLDLGDLLGDKSFSVNSQQPSRDAYTVSTPKPAQKGSSFGWLVPLLLLVALGALLWYIFSSRISPALPTVNTNVGACTSIAALEKGVTDSVSQFTADSKVSDVKDWFTKIKGSFDAVINAASAMGNLDIKGFQTAFTSVESAINGLTGDTLGDGLKTIQDSIATLTSASATLKQTVGCQ